jgi:VIT1/CCC1 family predicted Fe2+/Mn2+ transporter
VPILPPQYVALAYSVVVVGITLAAFTAYTRFTHQGGF